MKRIYLIISLLCLSGYLTAQMGVGWAQQRAKVNFKDSVNLANGLLIGGVVQTPANWNTAYTDRLKWDGGSSSLVAATGRTSLGATTVGTAFFTMTNPSAIRIPIIQADNSITNTAVTGTGNVVLSASPTLSGTVALGSGSITMTGSLAATGSRVLKGWFTDLEVTNLPTINGGTLKTGLGFTTVGNAFVTLSNPSAIAFPRINADNTVTALSAANFSAAIGTSSIIHDTIDVLRDSAIVGLAVEDVLDGTTGNDYYMTPTQIKSYVTSLANDTLQGKILRFIVGTTTGAPTTSDSTLIHSDFSGKHLDVYRDGALAYFNNDTTNFYEGFILEGDTLTVNPLWQDNEQVEIRILEPIYWSDITLSGQESALADSIASYYKFDDLTGNAVDAVGTLNLTAYGTPTYQQSGREEYGYSVHVDDDVADQYFSGGSSGHEYTTAFSVSVWVKSDAGITLGSVVGKMSSTQNGWVMRGASSKIQASIAIDGVYTSVTSSTTVFDQTWHHVVITYDGTIRLYVDGVAEGTPDAAVVGYAGGYDYFRVCNVNTQYSADCYIDNIGVWYKKLTAAEVLQQYNAELAGREYPTW